MIWTRAGHEFIEWSDPNDPTIWDVPPVIMFDTVSRDGRERVVRYRLGTADESVLQTIWRGGDYDLTHLPDWQRIWDRYRQITAAGHRPMIIDGGAHIGLASVWFALEFPLAEVVAIEPHGENFAMLAANVRGLPVTPVRAALTEKFGHVALTDPGQGNWAYQTHVVPMSAGSNILGLPVTEFVDPARMLIVKLDIEGAEADVLRTAADWLPSVPVLIVERHAWVTDRGEFGCLYDGRTVHHVGENIVSVRG
jgi:FkbM family methyltransferase